MWSYDVTQLSTPLNYVRLLIGDTNTDDQLLQDEEIVALVSQQPVMYAAAAAADAIAAGYSRLVDKQVGRLRLQSTQRIASYRQLAQRLRSNAAMGGVAPWAGGLSAAEEQGALQDDDLERPSFTRDTHDMTDSAPNLSPRLG